MAALETDRPLSDEERGSDEEEYDPLDVYDAADRFYKSRPMSIHFSKLWSLVENYADQPTAQVADTPPYNSTPSRLEHNQVHRELWKEMMSRVDDSAQVGGELALFDPPEKHLQVVFLNDEPSYRCPCCLGDSRSEYLDLITEDPQGITHRLLLEKLGQALYGTEQSPKWFVGGENDRPVVCHFLAMNQGKSSEGRSQLIGNLYLKLRGIRYGETEEGGGNHTKITMEELDGKM